MGYLVLIGSKYLVGNSFNIEHLVGQFLFSFFFFSKYGYGFDVLRVHADFFFFNLCYLFYSLRGRISFYFFEDIVGNFFFFFFRKVKLVLSLFRLYVYLLKFICWWVEERLGCSVELFLWDFVSVNLLDSNLERFDYLMRVYNLPILLDRLSFFFCELWKYEYSKFPVGSFELEVRFLYKLVFPEFFFVCLNDLLIISSEGELSLSGEVNEYAGDEVDVWTERLQHLDVVVSGLGGYSVLFLLQQECLQHFIFEGVDLSFSWLFFEDEFEYDLGEREILFKWLGVLAEDEQVILFGKMLLLFDWRNFLLDLWLMGFFSFTCSFKGWISVFGSLMRVFDLMECKRSKVFVCFGERFFFFDILRSVDFDYGFLRGVKLNLNTFFKLYLVKRRV